MTISQCSNCEIEAAASPSSSPRLSPARRISPEASATLALNSLRTLTALVVDDPLIDDCRQFLPLLATANHADESTEATRGDMLRLCMETIGDTLTRWAATT